MAIWDDLLSEADAAVVARYLSGGGRAIGGGDRPALLVVDMTNCFLDERFPTAVGDGAGTAVAAVGRLLAIARRQGFPVIFTTGANWPTAAELGRWKGSESSVYRDNPELPPPHGILSQLAPRSGEPVLVKSKPSAFFGTHLSSLLVYHRVDTVVVTGVVTSGCIRATVIDAFSLNYRVLVPEEATADRLQVAHKVNLLDVHLRYADVIPVDQAAAYLESAPAGASAQDRP